MATLALNLPSLDFSQQEEYHLQVYEPPGPEPHIEYGLDHVSAELERDPKRHWSDLRPYFRAVREAELELDQDQLEKKNAFALAYDGPSPFADLAQYLSQPLRPPDSSKYGDHAARQAELDGSQDFRSQEYEPEGPEPHIEVGLDHVSASLRRDPERHWSELRPYFTALMEEAAERNQTPVDLGAKTPPELRGHGLARWRSLLDGALEEVNRQHGGRLPTQAELDRETRRIRKREKKLLAEWAEEERALEEAKEASVDCPRSPNFGTIGERYHQFSAGEVGRAGMQFSKSTPAELQRSNKRKRNHLQAEESGQSNCALARDIESMHTQPVADVQFDTSRPQYNESPHIIKEPATATARGTIKRYPRITKPHTRGFEQLRDLVRSCHRHKLQSTVPQKQRRRKTKKK